MTATRRLLFVAFLLLVFLPVFAFAATTEFRTLIDADNNGATGCTLAGMNGVDHVLVTLVRTDATGGAVTRSYRLACTGGSFGDPVDVDTTGWGVGFNASTGGMVVENRIPFSTLTSSGTPVNLHLAFDANVEGSIHSAMTMPDGSPILYLRLPGRRHSVATPGSGPRTMHVDGLTPDWSGLEPILGGIADHGSHTLRMIRVWAFANTSDNFVYFRVDANLNSDAPFAEDDQYSRLPGQSLAVSAPGVLANDGDPNSHPLTVLPVSEPSHGDVVLNADGSFTYTPEIPLSNQTDSFHYKANNGTHDSNVAKVTIKVSTTGEDDPVVPIANDDSYTTTEDTPLAVPAPGVMANDLPPSAARTVTKLTDPTNGTVVLNSDGSFTYTPDVNFFGTDSFSYRLNFPAGTDTAVVTITIQAENDLPTIEDAAFTIPENSPNGTFVGTVIASDDDVSDTLTYAIIAGNTGGAFDIDANGTITVANSAALDFETNPVFTLTVQVADNAGATAEATVTITLTNEPDPPIATDDSATVLEDGNISVPAPGLLSNDTDPEGDSLTASKVTDPSNGVATVAANGAWTYQPNPDFFGTDSFTYQVSDGTGSDIGTVTITVTPVNDVPSFTAGPSPINHPADGGPYSQPWASNISAGPANESGQVLNFIVTNNNNALFSVQPSISPTGVLTFTPAGNLVDSATVNVQLHDNGGTANGGVDTTTLITFVINITCPSITVTNPATATGTAGTAFSQTFTQSGGIGAVTFTTASTLPAGLTLAANGVLSGTPTQTGTFPIVVTVTDSEGCTGTGATYNLTINCPTITVTNPANTSATTGSPFSETFTQTGAVGSATFTTSSTLPAGLTLSTAGVLSGTPTVEGTFPIVVTVTDANGCTGSGSTYTLVVACPTITVTNPANTVATVGVPFSETFTQTGAAGSATFTTSDPLPAGLTLSTAGVLSGTPTVEGTFPITVTVTDANGCTGTGSVYTLVVTCPTITVTNPANSNGTSGVAFSETFTQTGGIGTITWSVSSGVLPSGITLNPATGVLSGTTNEAGSFPITVTATDQNGCDGTGATYNLTIACQTITVTNPANSTGTVDAAFSETFTQTGILGTATWSIVSGTLPAGITLNPSTGVLSGTPTVNGTFPITVRVTDSNGCFDDSAYTLTINCQTITVTNPANANGTAGAAFSETFTQTGAHATATFTTSSTLPAGLTLSTAGVLSGTPTQTGTFPIVVTVTDANGCTGTSATYNLNIACQTIAVFNPANTNGTANAPFSETFTQSGAIGSATFTTASTLPAGLTLSTAGVLSGTPTETGTFPIVVTVTDANSCTGTSATYNLNIACQTITVTNPANSNGTVNAPFSETFTQAGAIGGATFTTASTLPAGLTLSTAGVLSGTPVEDGSFPIVVTVTDGNGCTGTSATYNLVIACQTITVGNPATTTSPAGTPLSINFTQTGAVGTAVFTTASTLPAGLTLAANGTLSGTPTEDGTFPIVVTVTDDNGCTGTNPSYSLTITCPTITVTNPANANGTSGAAFSETFSQTGGVGTITWSVSSGTLPSGITLNPSTGVLSGTTNEAGSFPITVTATDQNNCDGTGATYTLVIGCQTITITNPANSNGTVDAAFSETFSQTGILGTATWSIQSGTLPAGLSLATGTGVLSGTPTEDGTFPVTVRVTDTNGCFDDSSYTITIACQTITVTSPGNAAGTAGSAFSETFTQVGAHLTATFTTTDTLPAGLSLSTAGVLSGTPTQTGSFPIVVTVTDANGCTGASSTYNLVIGCQTITVTNPANAGGTANASFSETFTQTGAIGTATFTTTDTLPAGLSLSTAGVLSGTPTQTGSFPIVVTVTDSNSCTGTSATYNLNIACQTISVTNPSNTAGTVSASFTEQFTQTGAIGTATFTTASTLPAGLTLQTDGTLTGTPTEDGTFPIVVTVTDSNSCTGTSATYNLVIACQTITVSNPATTTSPAGTPLNIAFTQVGAVGTAVFTTSSTLPAGLTLNNDGTLTGTPTEDGTFPIAVLVTDANGCTGTNPSYSLTITCPVITVTNPGNSTGTSGSAFSETFSQTGGLGTITWSLASGTLPSGITLNSATGELAGTTNEAGVFPITVTATDQNGCDATGGTYNLTINCQTITVTNPAGNTGTVDAAFSETPSQTGILGTATWSIQSGTLPAGLSINPATGEISGTPTEDGTFNVTIRVTDTNACFDDSAYSITINCQTITVTNPGVTTGTVDAPFSQFFSQTGAHGTATFSTSSTLPNGLTLNSSTGELSGTPTEDGTFPIVVTVSDSNSCPGTGATYTLVIACQTITVTNPGVTSGTVGAPFSQFFTQSSTHTPVTFSTSSTLPTGFTLDSSTGELAGTTTQAGTFPIDVTVTDVNGCQGTNTTYTLVINCQTITVTNPAGNTGTVNAAFSETFSQTGIIGTPTWSIQSGTLPAGLSFNTTTSEISGTPTEDGSFPLTVRVTDTNGCFDDTSYTIVIACQTITVTNPGVTTGTAGTPFSQQFTQTSAVGTATFTTSSTLPAGLTLAADGTLSGTPTDVGTFNIDVLVTDSNGCTGTNTTYTLVISCQTVTVTNPSPTTLQAGVSADATYTFTATGILGTATWSVTSGSTPSGITLNSSTGKLEGSSTALGFHTFTVRVTDTNGCFDESSYTIEITCPTITVTRTLGGSFPNGTYNVAYTGESFSASGGTAPYTFTVLSGTFPTGLTLNNDGTITGSPSATGVFNFTVQATDNATCVGSQSFSISIAPDAQPDNYGTTVGTEAVGNTQVVVDGHSAPTTPFVAYTGAIVANDQPAGVTVTAVTNASTTLGGLITIDANGKFTYTPPVGVVGDDTYTYTITSNGVTDTAVITIRTADVIWYVNNTYAGANGASNGQSHRPFTDAATAAAAAQINQTIFVHTGAGNTTGAFVMKSGQTLHGNGRVFTLRGLTIAAGTNPTLSSAISLASNTTVRGLTTNNVAGSGITGAVNLGTSTIDFVTMNGVGGLALTSGAAGTLNVTNSTINTNGTFNAIRVDGTTAVLNVASSSTVAGTGGTVILLQNNTAGTVTIDAVLNSVTGQGAGNYAININTNSGTWGTSFTGVISSAANSGSGAAGNLRIASNTNTGGISFSGNPKAFVGGGTATGIEMVTNTGVTMTFSGGGLQVGTVTGVPFSATGGGTLTVSGTNNTITTTGATSAVNIANTTISGTGVTFQSVAQNGGTNGIVLNTTGAGTFSVTGTGAAGTGGTIQNTTGAGVSMTTTTAVSLTNVNLTTCATGISGTTFGTLTVSGVAITGTNTVKLNLVTGTVNGTFSNVDGTLNANSPLVTLTTIGGNFTVSAGALSKGGSANKIIAVTGGTLSFTWNGTLTQAQNDSVVTVSGGHQTGTLTFNGNISATNGTGLQFDNADGLYDFNGTTTLGGGDAGVDILNGSSGTFTFASTTSITGPTGVAFRVNGSQPTQIDYPGTITHNTGRAVELSYTAAATGNCGNNNVFSGNITSNGGTATGILIDRCSGGTATFSGATKTLNTGANNAVTISTNGSTVNFTNGGLDIDTTSGIGFTATGGGTVTVQTGANPNSILTTTGTALTMTTTQIGSAGMTFRRIDTDGTDAAPTNSIMLNNTGSTGGLTVTGTGAAGTGGTIRDTSGDAISLTSTGKHSFSYMTITSNLGSGIKGNTVNGLVVDNCSITANGDNTATDDSGIDIVELTGTLRNGTHPTKISNSTFNENWEFEIQVTNTTGTLTDLFLDSNSVTALGADGIVGNLINILQTGGTMEVEVNGGSVTGSAPATATGLQLDTAGGTLRATVNGGTYTNNNVPITVSTSSSGVLIFDLNGTTSTGNRAHGLNLFINASSTGSVDGTFRNNIIGTNGTGGSGSLLGFGLRVQNESTAGSSMPVNLAITGNTVQETAAAALANINQGLASGTAAPTHVTMTGNTFRNSAARAFNFLQNNNVNTTGSAGTSCIDLSGNTFTGTIPGQAGDGTRFRLRQLTGGTFLVRQTSAADIQANNTGVTVAQMQLDGTLTFNGGACNTPALP